MSGARRVLVADGASAQRAIAELEAEHGPGGRLGAVPLGTEVPWLLADLRPGLDPDLLAASVGAVRGGGTVLVVHDGAPRSPFEARFLASLRAWTGGEGRAPEPPSDPRFATADQERAFARASSALRKRRPLVLLADRGRGKSTLLGMLAAAAVREGRAPALLVTAPERASAAALLRALGEVPATFVPPDEVEPAVRRQRDAWVLVDEAAALPPDLVVRLARVARRALLATTVHGYEGTGRAFELAVLPRLDRPAVVRLSAPARWPEDDPVERWLAGVFLLDAEPSSEAPGEVRIAPDDLRDEATLRATFGLLIRAHYRTRPSDLRRLVDGDQRAILARSDGGVPGAVVVATEGGWDAEKAEAVARGPERPRGDLVPEVLAVHLARPDLARWTGTRIVRVAVREDARRRGLGRRLLEEVEAEARARGEAWTGASFAADPAVLRFWVGAGYRPVRLGFGASAVRPSVLVLKGLDAEAEAAVDGLWRRLGRELPFALAEAPPAVEPSAALAVLRACPAPAPAELDAQDRRELEACASGIRHWSWSARPVWELVRVRVADPAAPDRAAELLVAKVLLRRGWDRVAELLELDGPTAAIRAGRQALSALL